MSASISCNEQAQLLLEQCVGGEVPDASAARALVDSGCSDALFRVVVEGLADRFERSLCDAYASIFSGVIARVLPEFKPPVLRERYERVRRVRVCEAEPKKVFVLSRVTLGADIAVTSVILDAAKRRFRAAEIILVGSPKTAELFSRDPRIQHLPIIYPRGGSLAERLGVWKSIRIPALDSIVIDPDSRLTQLGLLPVCDEENYFFFESRAFGGDGGESLTTLAQRWAEETFGVTGDAFIAVKPEGSRRYRVAVSLGVGENPSKRIEGTFEEELLRYLGGLGGTLAIDKGAGGEEAARVERAIASANVPVETWNGSFAGFASVISQSDLYVGYDSAGQHAAAALGVPLVAVFSGFVCERMFQRWRPTGKGLIRIVRVDSPGSILDRTINAVKTL